MMGGEETCCVIDGNKEECYLDCQVSIDILLCLCEKVRVIWNHLRLLLYT